MCIPVTQLLITGDQPKATRKECLRIHNAHRTGTDKTKYAYMHAHTHGLRGADTLTHKYTHTHAHTHTQTDAHTQAHSRAHTHGSQ